MVRGAFGHALKDMACFSANHNHGKCVCQVEDACVYQQLFSPASQQSSSLARQYDVSPPIIVQAHALPEALEAGSNACFDVVCLGERANAQWPIIQLALQRALLRGIGWRHPHRGRAQLNQVEILPVAAAPGQSNAQSMHIQLLGHTRLQQHGQILSAQGWTAPLWFMALLRRYTLMQEAYQLPLPSINWQELSPLVAQLTWHSVALRDVHWTRWSNRQKKTVPLDGVTGQFVLQAVPPALQPYLHHGQWLHMGKNSMLGLGQYQIVPAPEALSA